MFLKAHFKQRLFRQAVLQENLGRVIDLHFGSEEQQLFLQLRLFPHGQNFEAVAEDKNIFFFKPKEIQNLNQSQNNTVRSLQEIRDEYFAKKQSSKTKQNIPQASQVHLSPEDLLLQKQQKWQKLLDSKKIALQKIEEQIKNLQTQKWQEWALQLQQTMGKQEIPELQQAIQKLGSGTQEKLEFATWKERMNFCFEQNKECKRKTMGLLERVYLQQQEIESLQELGIEHPMLQMSGQQSTQNKAEAKKELKLNGAKARIKRFDNELVAYVGRSAKDNMLLLRLAKPWFYWMHLLDQPGSHLIFQCPKNYQMSDSMLFELAEFFIHSSSLAKTVMSGDHYDLQISQCRFIKPIKGDKLGRVNVQEYRSLRYTCK